MSDYHLLAALIVMAIALPIVLYAIVKVFWPLDAGPLNPVQWDDEINGDVPHIGGGHE